VRLNVWVLARPNDPGLHLLEPAPDGVRFVVGREPDDFDGKVKSVTFRFPDGSVVADTRRPFRQAWDTTKVADGVYAMVAEATDDDGRMTSIDRRVLVDNTHH